MREMKDSGIEWIGEIPAEWLTKAIRYIINEHISGSWGNDEKNDDNDRICIRIADFDYARIRIKENIDYTVRNYSSNDIYYKTLKYGDLLVEKSGGGEKTPVGRTVVYRLPFNALFANFMDCIRLKGNYNVEYYKYVFFALYNNGITNLYFNQTTGIQNLNMTKYFREVKITVPNDKEQKIIASYLDAKCSEIDALVSDIQQQIETLEEYKRSVITEAVTKGLDPDAEMRDSGIVWVGDIPAHWSIIPFKYILNERNENNFPVKSNERLSLSIGLGVTLYSEKTTNLDRFKDDVSQYKLAHKGDLVMNSMNVIVGAVGVTNYYGCISPAYYCFYDNEEDHVTAKYCEFIFLSKGMRSVLYHLGKGIMAIDRGDGRVNTCRLKVSKYDINHLLIPFPPVDEQRRIVEYAITITTEVDEIIAEKKRQIETIEEYKKSLIFEYVTGKKEVV